MPNRNGRGVKSGGRGGYYNGNRNYSRLDYSDMHDNRDEYPVDKRDMHDNRNEYPIDKRDNLKGRRVSFKPSRRGGGSSGGGGGRRSGGLSDKGVRYHLEHDEDMDGGGSANRVAGTRGRGHVRSRTSTPSRFGGRKLTEGTAGWFQVEIPYMAKYGRQEVYRILLEHLRPNVFIPHYYKEQEHRVIFYLDDIEAAQKILDSDRKIKLPTGHMMKINVYSSIPKSNVDDSVVNRMKLAMVKRYNATTKALDLTKFHSDPDLLDVFCALFRPPFMMQAIKIIAENIPDLEALNLNENKIHLMTHFQELVQKIPNLKILYLANNKIPTLSSLDSLKGSGLVELMLDGNPFKERVNSKVYVSELRKRFPKLIKLDGQELPAQIGFDLESDAKLPPSKASFLCDPTAANVVRQFVQQYFTVFDSGNREPLLQAYHENAQLSMTIGSYQQGNQGKLAGYFQFSRNLLRIRDHEQKVKQLHVGRLPVVSFLSQLPATQHDLHSFAVDLTLYTPQLLNVTVSGIFKEQRNNNSNPVLRSFQRTMVIVPQGSGFCIRNEMVHINNVTPDQAEKAFKAPTVVVAAVPVAGPSAVSLPVAAAAPVPAAGIDDNTKMQMVQAMSLNSNMNVEWSRKCLEEVNWDFQRAAFVFAELHKQNKIPPEAFVK